MLDCTHVSSLMNEFSHCSQTDQGLQVSTHCLYPSFEMVKVFVVRDGDGFLVHDGGGALRSAWSHGCDRSSMVRAVAASAKAFGCDFARDQIKSMAVDQLWLFSSIMSVANASSDAARAAVGKARLVQEETLIQKTKAILDKSSWQPETRLDFVTIGRSGKSHSFDLAAISGGSVALIDAVVPHANSIAAKFLAFSDTEAGPGVFKYALYDGDLSAEDKTLLSGVADLISYRSIAGTDGKFLIN